jgi:UDP-N-acetylmuramoylalanine--D-glutamate ligase
VSAVAVLRLTMELKGKRVLVVGLGKSGVASSMFLNARGAHVTVSDAKPEAELRQHIPALLDRGITVETGAHGERTFRDQDLIVVSPGVPSDAAPLQQAHAQGTPVIGEIELAARFLQGRIVGITGSNGKTTTTALAGEVLARDGRPTLVGGNIGTPAISFVEQSTPQTWIVLEVSSFQLETIETFRPHIAVVLNVTPDHLDRHRTFDAYMAAKARIFENQMAADFAVLNAGDANCVRMAAGVHSKVCWFGVSANSATGTGPLSTIKDGDIVWSDGERNQRVIMPVSEVPLKGAHNLENVLAAVAVGVLAGVDAENVRAAVREFKAVEHRLEYVATIRGVEYYNDSKATNVDATVKALESFPANIHIILGGKDKDSDYTVLQPLLRERVKRVYAIGAAAQKIEQQITGAAEIVAADTLEAAVRQAQEAAAPGDIVLLAPACASFDQFDNYEHRGRVFKELVLSLAGRRAPSDVRGGAA